MSITVNKEPAIKVTDLNIDLQDLPEMQLAQKDIIGLVPYIQFKTMPIESSQINYCKIQSTGFLPEIELIFNDFMQTFRSEYFALDNEIISVYINSRIGSLHDIKMDFKITNYNYDQDSDQIYVYGTSNIDGIYLQQSYAIPNKSSYDALDEITSKLEIGLASNIAATNDTMTWVNPGTENLSFIQHITEAAYKDPESFFWSFIDLYYNLNFINVEEEMLSDASKLKGVLDNGSVFAEGKDQTLTNIVLYYTRDVQSNSNMMFNKYEIFNQSTDQSINIGYERRITFFDIYGNWEKKSGNYDEVTIQTSQAPGIAEQNIVLKSTPNDTTRFYKENIKSQYTGKLDRNNVHPNFRIAMTQNEFNIDELQKIYIIINLQNPNFNLHRFMKVKVDFMDIATPNADQFRNQRLSGAWLITGIIFELNEDGFVQKLVLCRRELTAKNFNV